MIKSTAFGAVAALALGLALPAFAAANPCAMKANPCAMKANPCAMKGNPCQPGASKTVSGARSDTAVRSRPLLVKIHADWCSSCNRIQPSIDALKARYGAGVDFVTLDVTDAKRAAQSRKIAKARGLAGFFGKYQSQTSTVAIFPAGSSRPAEILVGESDQVAYATVLDPLVAKGRAGGR